MEVLLYCGHTLKAQCESASGVLEDAVDVGLGEVQFGGDIADCFPFVDAGVPDPLVAFGELFDLVGDRFTDRQQALLGPLGVLEGGAFEEGLEVAVGGGWLQGSPLGG